MAEDRIGKLFLLAMCTSSDAEALSALEMIKTVLKKKGIDAHLIADALNPHPAWARTTPILDSSLAPATRVRSRLVSRANGIRRKKLKSTYGRLPPMLRFNQLTAR